MLVPREKKGERKKGRKKEREIECGGVGEGVNSRILILTFFLFSSKGATPLTTPSNFPYKSLNIPRSQAPMGFKSPRNDEQKST
jgi:hypothetical protein